MIKIIEYLASFYELKGVNKFVETESNQIIFHRIQNGWVRQAYVQRLNFESVAFKKSINMFERMEIDENIYEGVLETHYKNKLVKNPPVTVTSLNEGQIIPINE